MTNLPDFLKAKIVDTIEDSEIKNYLTIESADITELQKMIVWTKRQDIFRNQDYATAFPNTYELLKPYWSMIDNLHE
jgi:hypothetical protein